MAERGKGTECRAGLPSSNQDPDLRKIIRFWGKAEPQQRQQEGPQSWRGGWGLLIHLTALLLRAVAFSHLTGFDFNPCEQRLALFFGVSRV